MIREESRLNAEMEEGMVSQVSAPFLDSNDACGLVAGTAPNAPLWPGGSCLIRGSSHPQSPGRGKVDQVHCCRERGVGHNPILTYTRGPLGKTAVLHVLGILLFTKVFSKTRFYLILTISLQGRYSPLFTIDKGEAQRG